MMLHLDATAVVSSLHVFISLVKGPRSPVIKDKSDLLYLDSDTN